MIFEALQFELFRFKFHSLGSKILKFPGFNLGIYAKKYSKNHLMPKNKSKIYAKNDVKIRLHSIQFIPKKSNFYIKGLFQRTLGILNPEIIMVFGISG